MKGLVVETAARPEDREADRRGSANHEKKSAALSSVLAAFFLTGIKAVVGATTGSLGILSEALHSGLDLAAAIVTWLAVRVSGRPADARHTYGHGKVENLSALFETILLLATCVWIIYEAVERLAGKNVAVDANIWAFGVMATSIIVDVSRSRYLLHVARKHQSQALEADALHFSTDVWSSAVVIVGLVLVRLAEYAQSPWLVKADAVAALVVALIVIWISIQLGRRSIADLLDEVSPALRDSVAKAARVPGVLEVLRVRARKTGAEAFIDVALAVERATSLERGHEIATAAEIAIQRVVPGADVTVHVEPAVLGRVSSEPPVAQLIRQLATAQRLAAHDIHVHNVLGERYVELHIEVADSLDVATAHAQADAFETALRRALPELTSVVTHIEPTRSATHDRISGPVDENQIRAIVQEVSAEHGGMCVPHEIRLAHTGNELVVSFHCKMHASMPITSAHDLTARVEAALRQRLPNLGRVFIHVEPR